MGCFLFCCYLLVFEVVDYFLVGGFAEKVDQVVVITGLVARHNDMVGMQIELRVRVVLRVRLVLVVRSHGFALP